MQEAYAKNKGNLKDVTKESERARINASNIVKKYIDDASVLMGGYENAIAVRTIMHEDMKNARDSEMGKQADQENRYQKARTITAEVPGYREAQQTNEKTAADIKKISEAYGDKTSNKTLIGLSADIQMGRMDVNPSPSSVLNTMAKMVTYDLIARERVGLKPDEMGPIERQYRAGSDAFIQGLENSQTLKTIADSVAKNGEMRNFMASAVGDNMKKLGDNVLLESKGQQMQQPKVSAMEQVIQNQAVKAPEPPKPSGPAVG